jgi:hypothetical protein
MIEFTDTSLQLQSILTPRNQWLSTTRYVPYSTTRAFSCTVANDERWIIELLLNYYCFITSKLPKLDHYFKRFLHCPLFPLQRKLCLAACYLATTRSLLFVAAGMWLPSRCSPMDVCSCCTIPDFRRCLPKGFLTTVIFRHKNIYTYRVSREECAMLRECIYPIYLYAHASSDLCTCVDMIELFSQRDILGKIFKIMLWNSDYKTWTRKSMPGTKQK